MLEKIEDLGGGIKIVINKEINFTTDSILLADFSSSYKKCRALDIGSGCGIIPLLWLRNKNKYKITAVEIHKASFNLLERSIKLNNLENEISAINCNISTLCKAKNFLQYFDIIASNPPYSVFGKRSKSEAKAIANHETFINIEEIIKLSYLFLKNGGYLYLCCRINRLSDVIFNMKKYKIEPKILKLVEYKEGAPPKLFLIKGKKNSKPGIVAENNLVLQTKGGEYSNELKRILSCC